MSVPCDSLSRLTVMGDRSQTRRDGVASGRDGPSRLATGVFAFLVVAALGSFFVIQRLKHTPTPVQAFMRTPSFLPTARPAASCRAPLSHAEVLASRRNEYFSFRVARSEQVSVSILASTGRVVANVVSNLPLHAYRRVSLCWNGQSGASENGGLAPPGEYRIRVTLPLSGREIEAPLSFTLRAR